MFFAKSLVLLSFALSVLALTTPHFPRAHHHRRSLSPNVVASPLDSPLVPRRESKRCRPRPTSSSVAPPQTTAEANAHTTSVPPPPPSPTREPEHTTTTKQPEHATTTKQPEQAPPPPTTTHTSPKPTHTGGIGLPSFLVGTQTGQGTFYATGLGACGITNNDGQHIVAVSHLLFDAFPGYNGINPNANPVCNKQVRVSYQGKSVTVTITDRCEGCALTDLDFSPSAFNQLASFDVGRISGMTWEWL